MDITLKPEGAENPLGVYMTCCRQCGKGVGILMAGRRDYYVDCPKCSTRNYGESGKCGNCSERLYGEKRVPLKDGEEIPIEICDDCQKKNEECTAAVAAGGVHWRCKKCGSAGAIKAEAQLAKNVREKMSIQAPDPCGVEFDTCPVCEKAK